MKLGLVAALTALALVGCVQDNQVWEKVGAQPNEYSKDRYACLQQSQQRYSSRSGSYGHSEVITNRTLFNACMNASGWTLTEKSDGGTTPYQDAIEAVLAQQRALCEREDLRALLQRMPCTSTKATLAQLSDRTRLGRTDKPAFAAWRAASGELLLQRAAAHRQHNPRTGEAMAQLMERNGAALEKLALDFYEGRLSYGEFNQRRRDIDTRDGEELRKIAQN